VLASCASGATPLGEFWGSLGAALLAAGARGVVAALHSVDDAVTAELIDQFYDRGGASDPAAALAAAQRALATHRPASAWGAFVFIGAAGAREVP
jgi:CHAT domain-containing protein